MTATHPAAMNDDKLLAVCTVRRQKRSGPGGQHRNKVETGIVLVHVASGVRAEACERRSQAQNLQAALFRMRIKLAIGIRSALDGVNGENQPSELWQSRVKSGRIPVSAAHADFPALLAELLDTARCCEFDLQAAAERLGTSCSQLMKLLRHESEALDEVNRQRLVRDLRPLR